MSYHLLSPGSLSLSWRAGKEVLRVDSVSVEADELAVADDDLSELCYERVVIDWRLEGGPVFVSGDLCQIAVCRKPHSRQRSQVRRRHGLGGVQVLGKIFLPVSMSMGPFAAVGSTLFATE